MKAFLVSILLSVFALISIQNTRAQSTEFYLVSSDQSLIGQGIEEHLRDGWTVTIEAVCLGDRPPHAIEIVLDKVGDPDHQWRSLSLAVPMKSEFVSGQVYRATKYVSRLATEASLDFSGKFDREERSNNDIVGWFKVLEIKLVDNTVVSFAADFYQLDDCQDSQARVNLWNFGSIRYESTVPVSTARPAVHPALTTPE